MGRKGKWFLAVRRALTPQCNKKSFKSQKSKNKSKIGNSEQSDSGEASKTYGCGFPQRLPPPSDHHEIKVIRREDEQNRHAYSSVALASAVAAEAAAVAAQAAAEVARLTTSTVITPRVPGRSREETAFAAVKIQTAFRGYLARRSALWGLKRLVRLKTTVDGAAVVRQTRSNLHDLQTMSRIQLQICSRRVRLMTEENQLAFQRQLQLQLKHESELTEKSNIGEEWDGSLQTKEQIEARLLYRHEAAMRRERTLAYAFSHQRKSSSRAVTPGLTDLNNPQWSWSWTERWMAARPWEGENDHASMKNASHHNVGGKKTIKANRDSSSSSSIPDEVDRIRTLTSSRLQSPATPPPSMPPSAAAGKRKSSSPGMEDPEDDESRSSRSTASLQTGAGRPRRHSSIISTGSSVTTVSLTSAPPAMPMPGYMASTESARFRSRFHSDGVEAHENRSICSVQQRLPFPAS